ncbi:hypothetical protein AGMMS49982_21400 [Bacteroidia bacterium]|nr:hypothetical protein AGMMS49982_21400 [Bacteroidia bacterium]
MGKHGLTPYPYPFMLEYKKMPFAYVYDEPLEMRYVIYQGKKLYFPKECDKNFTLEVIYKSLLIEQDPRSPHRYIANLNRLAGKTILDIGVAEGIFSLAVIEIITHAYLFECDEMWIKALNATFAPWKEKVTIVPKYVSDKDDENNITIDHFLEGKSKNNLFLKMDIEGYEQAALKGAANLLQTAKDVDYSITTYHRTNDAVEIDKMLSDYGFESEFTEGFLYFEKELRRAIIRGDQACFVLEKCK